jgi:hypothetical protein
MFNSSQKDILNVDEENISTENVWLKLILGHKNETVEDSFASDKALQSITALSNWLKEQKNFKDIPDEEINVMATNLFVANTLKIQREITPNGHKALFVNSFAEHPDLVSVREDIRKKFRKSIQNINDKILIYVFFAGAITSPIAYAFAKFLYNIFQ